MDGDCAVWFGFRSILINGIISTSRARICYLMRKEGGVCLKGEDEEFEA
jgi:hypothetical protein